jgi:hypothetical protein
MNPSSSSPPPRRTLSQLFSLFDQQHCGFLSGAQFFNLVRALLSLLHSHTHTLSSSTTTTHARSRHSSSPLLLPLECEEVHREGTRIANSIQISRENQISYEEFLAACHCHPTTHSRTHSHSHQHLRPSPFEPFFGVMKVFFTEPNYPILNELFPFEPTYEYQTLYDWQSVLPNCESILPLSDSRPASRHSTLHPLDCYGTKKARISEECQFALRIGKPALLDPVRVRLLRNHTVADLLQRATNAWPAHHRPAPPTSALSLVWRRPLPLPENAGDERMQQSRPHSYSDASMSSHDSQGEPKCEELELELSATIEQIGLFFHYRDCEIHVHVKQQDSFIPPTPTSSQKAESHRGSHSRGETESHRHQSPPPLNSQSRYSAPRRHGSPNGNHSNSNSNSHHHTTDRHRPHSPNKASSHKHTPQSPLPTQHHHPVDSPPLNTDKQPQKHTCPPVPSAPSAAQLLVTRLSDDFSRLRVQMQQETRRLEHFLSPWDDSLTMLRDEVPPRNTSWPDGSILTDVDREDLRVQANALKEDLRAMHNCLESLHVHRGD